MVQQISVAGNMDGSTLTLRKERVAESTDGLAVTPVTRQVLFSHQRGDRHRSHDQFVWSVVKKTRTHKLHTDVEGPSLAVTRNSRPNSRLGITLRSSVVSDESPLHRSGSGTLCQSSESHILNAGVNRCGLHTHRTSRKPMRANKVLAAENKSQAAKHCMNDMSHFDGSHGRYANTVDKTISRTSYGGYHPASDLIRPDPNRIKRGFWRSVSLTPGEHDLKRHFLRRSGNSSHSKVRVNKAVSSSGFDSSQVVKYTAAKEKQLDLDVKSDSPLSDISCITSDSLFSLEIDLADQKSSLELLTQRTDKVNCDSATRRIVYTPCTDTYILHDTNQMRTSTPNCTHSTPVKIAYPRSRFSHSRESTRTTTGEMNNKRTLSSRSRSAHEMNHRKQATSTTSDIRRLRTVLASQRVTEAARGAVKLSAPTAVTPGQVDTMAPGSNSLSLYNLSLHAAANSAVAHSAVAEEQSDVNDRELNLSPATWVRILKANPGDPALIEQRVHDPPKQMVPAYSNYSNAQEEWQLNRGVLVGHSRASTSSSNVDLSTPFETGPVLPRAQDNLVLVNKVQMPTAVGLNSTEHVLCRVPQNSPEPEYLMEDAIEIPCGLDDKLACTKNSYTSLPSLPIRKIKKQPRQFWESANTVGASRVVDSGHMY